MKCLTLKYQNEDLILKVFSIFYGATLFLQLYWDQYFILNSLPEFKILYIVLCCTLIINPLLKTQFTWTWLITTVLYWVLMTRFLEVKTGSNPYAGGLNFAMPFWVFLVLGLQKFLNPSRTIFLVKFLLLFSYFAGGVAKIRHGLDWMNGWTLQYYFLQRHMDLDIPEGWWLMSNLTRAKFLSWSIVLIELCTPLAFFNRKFEWLLVAFYFSFQVACYYLMKLKFMNYYGWSYLIYASILIVYLYDRYKKRASSGE